MNYYFCLVNNTDKSTGVNVGRTYAYQHRSEWISIPGSDISQYLTTGYVKGVDYVVYNNKAYMIMKSYLDLNEKFVVLVCTESISGCDI